MFLAPSQILYGSVSAAEVASFESNPVLMQLSWRIAASGEMPKLQVIQNEGQWFALNDSHLQVYRQLEIQGVCTRVKVDVVPLDSLPETVRNLLFANRSRANKPTTSGGKSQSKSSSSKDEICDETYEFDQCENCLNDSDNESESSESGAPFLPESSESDLDHESYERRNVKEQETERLL